MVLFDPKKALFERAPDGELLPMEVPLLVYPENPVVKIRPLLRGDLNRIKDIPDNEILEKCLVEPKFVKERLPDLKDDFVQAVLFAIIALSRDISQERLKEAMKPVGDPQSFREGTKTSEEDKPVSP